MFRVIPTKRQEVKKNRVLVLFPVLVLERFKSATTTPTPTAFVGLYDREVLALKRSIGVGSAGSLTCYHGGENTRGYRPNHIFLKDGAVAE